MPLKIQLSLPLDVHFSPENVENVHHQHPYNNKEDVQSVVRRSEVFLVLFLCSRVQSSEANLKIWHCRIHFRFYVVIKKLQWS